MKPPNARLERWLLSLQQYTFKIVYIPSRKNSADRLNRLPVDEKEMESGICAVHYAFSVVMDSVPAKLNVNLLVMCFLHRCDTQPKKIDGQILSTQCTRQLR